MKPRTGPSAALVAADLTVVQETCVAATHRWKRIAAIRRLKEFLVEYSEAFQRYLVLIRSDLSRARNVLFPAGTYLMRVRFALRCQAPP